MYDPLEPLVFGLRPLGVVDHLHLLLLAAVEAQVGRAVGACKQGREKHSALMALNVWTKFVSHPVPLPPSPSICLPPP